MESNEDLNQSCHDKISKLIGKGNKIINEAAENKVGTHYMIMGATNEGKTTLFYLLGGGKLQGIENDEGDLVLSKMESSKSILQQAEIAEDRTSSTTKLPLVQSIEIDGKIYYFWDTPGSQDTRGIVDEICNGFYINQLFETIKNVRFMFVSSADRIKLNQSREFLVTIDQFARKFSDISILENNIQLIVTKCDTKRKKEQILVSINKALNLKEETLTMYLQTAERIENVKKVLQYMLQSVYLLYLPEDINIEYQSNSITEIKSDIIKHETSIENISQHVNQVSIQTEAQQQATELFDESNKILNEELQGVAVLINDRAKEINNPDNIERKTMYESVLVERRVKRWFREDKWKLTTEIRKKQIEQCKKLLAIDHILTFQQSINLILGNDTTLDQLKASIQSIFRVLVEWLSDEQKQELMNKKEVIDQKIEYVKFFSKVCNNRKVNLQDLSKNFEEAQKELLSAKEKGIREFNLPLDNNTVDFYNLMIKFILEDPQAKSMDNLVKNLSNSFYCLGNLHKEEKQYQDSLKNYILALKNLPESEFKKTIFENINDIFYLYSDAFAQIKRENINFIFEGNFGQLDQDFREYSQILVDQLTKYFKEKETVFSKKKYISESPQDCEIIFNLHKIQQQVLKISQQNCVNTFKNGEWLNRLESILDLIKDPKKSALLKKININIELLSKVNEELKNAKNNSFQDYQTQFFQPLLSSISSILSNIITNLQLSPKPTIKVETPTPGGKSKDAVSKEQDQIRNYLNNMIKCYEILPKKISVLKQLGETLNRLGNLEEGLKDYEKSNNYYEKSLKINKDQPEIYEKLAQNYEKLENYSKAQSNYAVIDYFEKCIECFEKQEELWKKDDVNQYIDIVSQKSDYYAKNGCYDTSIRELRKLVPLCKFDTGKRKNIQLQITKQLQPQFQQQILEHSSNLSEGKTPFYPVQDWKAYGDTNEIQNL